MPGEALQETIQEEMIDETVSALDPVSDRVSGDADLTSEAALESAADLDSSDPVGTLSDLWDAINPFAVGSDELPWNAVVFFCEGEEILFPMDYAGDVYVQDGELINTSSNYTFGVVLRDSGLNNYVSSEVTVPTYHSSTWYQYLYTYGQPYRVVDRYISNYGSYSSSTRETVDLEFSGGNDWAGFGYELLFLFVILILLVMREVRNWLI